jgi:hypothetical protein
MMKTFTKCADFSEIKREPLLLAGGKKFDYWRSSGKVDIQDENVGARFHLLKLWYSILDGDALVSRKQWVLIKSAVCSLTFYQETMAESIFNAFSPVWSVKTSEYQTDNVVKNKNVK